MRGNTVRMSLSPKKTAYGESVYQYDYGQILIIDDFKLDTKLPDSYEVHFSTEETGNSFVIIATGNRVEIPDILLTYGKRIYVWVYLHTTENDGETEFKGIIPVIPRAKANDITPTPVEQALIDSLMAALNAGVGTVEDIMEALPTTINTYLEQAKESGVFDGATFIPSVSNIGVISWTNDKGLPNPDPINLGDAFGIPYLARKSEIPTKVSDLVDDSGHYTKPSTGIPYSDLTEQIKTDIDNKLDYDLKGSVNGIAELDENGKVPSTQLPSFVDDILEFPTREQFPDPGESGKIYIALNTNKTYRWGGTTYVEIASSLSLGETSGTAYRGDRGKIAYDHAVNKGYNFPLGFYKFYTNSQGHVVGVTDVTASDIAPFVGQSFAEKTDTVLLTTLSCGRDSSFGVGIKSIAYGDSAQASGAYSSALGYHVVASGDNSHAEGAGTRATGGGSHAEGAGSSATGNQAHAEGSGTTASGAYSHSEGSGTKAVGSISHAEGGQTTANGANSHAEGGGTQANGYASHAEGAGSTASGNYSHAEGSGTIASGSHSHSEGGGSIASGNGSHAEGGGTVATGDYSHVFGTNNVADSYSTWTEWVANTSYSVGNKVKITNGNTITGYICKEANSDSTFTSSKWLSNVGKMNYVEIVGNGYFYQSTVNSNARTLDWDGNERLMGDIYVGCNADSSGGTKLEPVIFATNNEVQAIIDDYTEVGA